ASAESRGANPVRPAIVFIHGGAWLAGDKEDVLDEPVILDAAEQAGFHLISVGYRLAGIAPDTAPWPAQIHDVNAAIRWIKQNAAMLDVDPERLVLVGGSAGAHIAAAAAYGSDVNELQGPENLVPPTQTDVALAFLIFGAYDMNMISQDGFDLVDDGTCNVLDLVGITAVVVLLDCGFSLEVDPLAGCSQDALDSASPVMNVDSSDPPSYLVHGRDDCVVPYLQTVGMESALNIAGVTNETMIVADGVHDSMSLMLDVEGILEFIDDNMEP
ncbi:MAG: alpha/beta hydrolase, partial [Thermodesulfobacteriota bacterium]